MILHCCYLGSSQVIVKLIRCVSFLKRYFQGIFCPLSRILVYRDPSQDRFASQASSYLKATYSSPLLLVSLYTAGTNDSNLFIFVNWLADCFG